VIQTIFQVILGIPVSQGQPWKRVALSVTGACEHTFNTYEADPAYIEGLGTVKTLDSIAGDRRVKRVGNACCSHDHFYTPFQVLHPTGLSVDTLLDLDFVASQKHQTSILPTLN